MEKNLLLEPDQTVGREISGAPDLITVPVAAARLGLSRSKLYELIADGELPTVRIGRARRIAVDDLRSFIAQRRVLR